MARKYFKEKQRYRRWEIIALLAFFVGGLTYRFAEQYFYDGGQSVMPVWTYLILTVPLVGVIVYYMILRLSIRVTDKHISVKYHPWQQKRKKIKWDEVAECEIVETPEAAQWNGWNINFNHEKRYSFCGRNGLHLTTQDGREIFVGSRKLDELEDAVKQALQAQH